MMDLLSMHKQFLQAHIKPGSTVADFTMGNGHDTLYLAQAVGENGRVYAFDIQPQAVENTRERLTVAGVDARCTLICDSHAEVLSYIHEEIDAGVFNLGWLPGSDRKVTTMRQSTRRAVEGALSLLAPGGLLLVAVYPGHAEGEAEGEMLCAFFSTLSRFDYSATRVSIVNSPTAPYFFAVERTEAKPGGKATAI